MSVYLSVCLSVCLSERVFLSHFATHWDALWHIVAFWSREGSKSIILLKTPKMWVQRAQKTSYITLVNKLDKTDNLLQQSDDKER